MLFHSLDFAIFLPVVFSLYWFVTSKNLNLQNTLIVASSYIFYGWWDWRFLGLIIFSSLLDFVIGLRLGKEQNEKKRKLLVSASILVNLGMLGFFKYYNFFLENFIAAFSLFGQEIEGQGLSLILPVGISFYTFQTLSYTIDVFRKRLEPTNNFLAFSAFVCFFPQLVAGPIERATNLLPQFLKKRKFEYDAAVDGIRQILWGFFKKVVIADNCAVYANLIFNDFEDYNGSTLMIGAIFFAFQIYGDFSGYSDIAIGTSRLFGFGLMQNFASPYFARDMAEFWRRWHISLSTWFRDYLYIPLGGSRGGTKVQIRNTFAIFIVSGFWHGANWTFIAWGLLNAIYFVPLMLAGRNRTHLGVVAEGKSVPSLVELFQMISTFCLTTLAWIFFRSPSFESALEYVNQVLLLHTWNLDALILNVKQVSVGADILYVVAFVFVLLAVEWVHRTKPHPLHKLDLRLAGLKLNYFTYLLIISIIYSQIEGGEEFIYFQF